MKNLETPKIKKQFQTSSGAKLLIESWPRPTRNRLGRVTGFLHKDIISTISLDVAGLDEWMKPTLMRLEDLEDQTSSGAEYRKEFDLNLHLMLAAIGADRMTDWDELHRLVMQTRTTLINSAN